MAQPNCSASSVQGGWGIVHLPNLVVVKLLHRTGGVQGILMARLQHSCCAGWAGPWDTHLAGLQCRVGRAHPQVLAG